MTLTTVRREAAELTAEQRRQHASESDFLELPDDNPIPPAHLHDHYLNLIVPILEIATRARFLGLLTRDF